LSCSSHMASAELLGIVSSQPGLKESWLGSLKPASCARRGSSRSSSSTCALPGTVARAPKLQNLTSPRWAHLCGMCATSKKTLQSR
jgi:hypothetical protein